MKSIIKFGIGCVMLYFILCFFPLFITFIFLYGVYKLGDKIYNSLN